MSTDLLYRFKEELASPRLKLAAVIHPKWRLDWIHDPDEKREYTDQLKREVQRVREELQKNRSKTPSPNLNAATAARAARAAAMEVEEEGFESVLSGMRDPFSSTNNAPTQQAERTMRDETSINDMVRRFLEPARKRKVGKMPDGKTDKFETVDLDHTSFLNEPELRALYVELNTRMPSSAAAERLFSIAKLIFGPLRTRLTGRTLNRLIFIHNNRHL